MTVALGVITARGRVKCDPMSLDKTRRDSRRLRRLRRDSGETQEIQEIQKTHL